MASTYTTNLRLTKQGDGDNPNTWGEVLNNVISLVDQAVASYTTVSIGSAATVTLTENQGSQDQSRSAILEFKGTVGGANTSIFVLIPNTPKSYAIRNAVSANTTASDAVILRVAGNTGVTVPVGGTGFFLTNGTSVFSLDAEGFGLGTAATKNVGVCATNLPDTSLADIRYIPTSVSSTIVAEKTFTASVIFTSAVIMEKTLRVQGNISISGAVKSYITTLTDAASIAIDFDDGNLFLVTLGGNRTLAAPSNATAGQTGSIYVVQDGTGSRTLGYNAVYQFPSGSVPVATTTTSGVDLIIYSARSATVIDAVMLKDFKR
jgi:hypothetical protein|tara:strand:+ start:229 stop:1188 length:960 start_codon:yes stop_codon:yes gene_type:complete